MEKLKLIYKNLKRNREKSINEGSHKYTSMEGLFLSSGYNG